MKNFVVKDTENGMRLLRLVQLLTVNMPKSMLYKSFRNGRVKIFDKKQKENYRVKTGDVLSLYINDEFFEVKKEKLSANPSFDFTEIYIDEHIAIIQKGSGVLCHSDETKDPNLLDGFIAKHGSGKFRPCLINRLDRGTEGLIIVARTHNAAEHAAELIREKKVVKRYLAVTDGAADGMIITGYSRHDRVTPATPGDKMITEFKTIKSCNGYYLVEAVLHTGKTHQIRAQLASLGVHIVGDRKYLSKADITQPKNQLLCAYELQFEDGLSAELSGVSGKTFTVERCKTLSFFNKQQNG